MVPATLIGLATGRFLNVGGHVQRHRTAATDRGEKSDDPKGDERNTAYD